MSSAYVELLRNYEKIEILLLHSLTHALNTHLDKMCGFASHTRQLPQKIIQFQVIKWVQLVNTGK